MVEFKSEKNAYRSYHMLVGSLLVVACCATALQFVVPVLMATLTKRAEYS